MALNLDCPCLQIWDQQVYSRSYFCCAVWPMEFVSFLQDLLRVVEAARELLVQERQEKLQLEMRLREEICNEMLEHMQQKEQWCRYSLCWSPSLCSGWARVPLPDPDMYFALFVANMWMLRRSCWKNCMRINWITWKSHWLTITRKRSRFVQGNEMTSGKWQWFGRWLGVLESRKVTYTNWKTLLFVMLFDSLTHNFRFLSTALCSSLGFLIFSP